MKDTSVKIRQRLQTVYQYIELKKKKLQKKSVNSYMGNLRQNIFKYKSPSICIKKLHQGDRQTDKHKTDSVTYRLNLPIQ